MPLEVTSIKKKKRSLSPNLVTEKQEEIEKLINKKDLTPKEEKILDYILHFISYRKSVLREERKEAFVVGRKMEEIGKELSINKNVCPEIIKRAILYDDPSTGKVKSVEKLNRLQAKILNRG